MKICPGASHGCGSRVGRTYSHVVVRFAASVASSRASELAKYCVTTAAYWKVLSPRGTWVPPCCVWTVAASSKVRSRPPFGVRLPVSTLR